MILFLIPFFLIPLFFISKKAKTRMYIYISSSQRSSYLLNILNLVARPFYPFAYMLLIVAMEIVCVFTNSAKCILFAKGCAVLMIYFFTFRLKLHSY